MHFLPSLSADPFETETDFPDDIEHKIECGQATTVSLNRWGTLLAVGYFSGNVALYPALVLRVLCFSSFMCIPHPPTHPPP